MKTNDIANYLLESSPIPQNSNTVIPGTSQLRNDYYTKVWPHGMSSDVSELTPKEINDLIVFQTETIEPRFIYLYIKQSEDNLALLEKEGQKNRVQDLKIRIAICYASLIKADHLGKYVKAEG